MHSFHGPRRNQASGVTFTGQRLRLVVSTLIAGLLVAMICIEIPQIVPPSGSLAIGQDFDVVRDAAARWLAGGQFYPAYELAGPFWIGLSDVLYPPPALLLFAPFTVLPAVLWWLVPLAVLGLVVAACRPRPLALLAIVACVLYPKSIGLILAGNPAIWLAAAMAVGVRWGWPAIVFLFKPTLAPLALVGVRHRSWWVAAGVAAIVSLAFFSMWRDYVTVLQNAQNPRGPFYSIGDVPLILIGGIAWAGRKRPEADEFTQSPTTGRPPA
jgi:hypothetical protein